MKLNAAQTDRAVGVLLAAACGDALGAGYEFGAVSADLEPEMIGGGLGGFTPGEWTDDTAQAVAIAEVAATGVDLRTADALDAIAQKFADWYAGDPADVGVQTSAVLSRAGRTPTGAGMTAAAMHVQEKTGRSAGNGSLMRTGVIALAYLDDPDALAEAAMAVSALTHYQDIAQQACAVWCLMIRHAVIHGEFPTFGDIADHVPNPSYWADLLAEAEQKEPCRFATNAWAVGALQAAWSAITHTPVPHQMPCRHLADSLTTAIRIGHDTDTVAAIAGALLGARWGISAIPARWRRIVHGWPGRAGQELVELAHLIIGVGRADRSGFPGIARLDYSHLAGHDALVQHPHDDGVWIGGITALDRLPTEIDAVVTLCWYGSRQVPCGVEHVVFRLIDESAEDNPNLSFVIDDAAHTVAALRAEGKKVYLHCVAAHSRTPTVAARYGVILGHPAERALQEVVNALPAAHPNPVLVAGLLALPELPTVSLPKALQTEGDTVDRMAEGMTFEQLCLLFVRSLLDKAHAFEDGDLSKFQRSRLGEAMTADIRKLGDMVFPAVRKPRVSAAAKLIADSLDIDLGQATWHSQKKIDGYKTFTYEHMYPVREIRAKLTKAATVSEALDVLDRMLWVAWITKDEDERLRERGFASRRDDPSYAYKVAGIELLPEEPST